jgi:DNA polymerase-4
MALIRHIVHLNVTGFAAQVATVHDPTLAGRAFVVGLAHVPRAVVMDVSPEAFSEGIVSGMPLSAARARVRGLIVVPPATEGQAKVARALWEIAGALSPQIELGPRAHLYLDLTGTRRLHGHAVDTAARLQKLVRSRCGLEPTCALAPNKLVSRVATRVVRPLGFVAIPAGDEADFLCPQPVQLLPGAGEAAVLRLHYLGVDTAGELAALDEALAVAALGATGLKLRLAAAGVDPTPVGRVDERTITESLLLQPDTCDPVVLSGALWGLVEALGFSLRTRELATGRITLTITDNEQKERARQATSREPLWRDEELAAVVFGLLARAAPARLRVRRLHLQLSALAPPRRQLDLFTTAAGGALQDALDDLRRTHGRAAIRRGCVLAAGRGELFPGGYAPKYHNASANILVE